MTALPAFFLLYGGWLVELLAGLFYCSTTRPIYMGRAVEQ